MVSVFDANGNFISELIGPGGQLESPWGIAIAPAGFFDFSGDLLVGNFGNGEINAFNPVTGAFLGTLMDGNGDPIVNQDLWALAVDPGSSNPNAVYFTAGIDHQTEGLFGELTSATPELEGRLFSERSVALRLGHWRTSGEQRASVEDEVRPLETQVAPLVLRVGQDPRPAADALVGSSGVVECGRAGPGDPARIRGSAPQTSWHRATRLSVATIPAGFLASPRRSHPSFTPPPNEVVRFSTHLAGRRMRLIPDVTETDRSRENQNQRCGVVKDPIDQCAADGWNATARVVNPSGLDSHLAFAVVLSATQSVDHHKRTADIH